ncbi:hypothetical protein ACX3VG_23905, partial [Escherichia coli]
CRQRRATGGKGGQPAPGAVQPDAVFTRQVRLSQQDFPFQAEDGIRDDVESRGLGDVYKRQA